MNITENILALANAYDEKLWKRFSGNFPDSDTDIEGLPKDIANVLCVLIGKEETKEWIEFDLELLDGNSVLELLTTTTGMKAVKMFVLTLPC